MSNNKLKNTQTDPADYKNFKLKFTRSFSLALLDIWELWTTKKIEKWLLLPGFYFSNFHAEFKPETEYEACMVSQEGVEYCFYGTYKKVDEHKAIVFTKALKIDHTIDHAKASLCKVYFKKINELKTNLIFTQTGFQQAEEIEFYRELWRSGFDKIKKHAKLQSN